jgi:hypothetical protein
VLVHLLDRSGRVFNILTSAERAVITTILQSPTAIEALNTVEAEYDGPYCTAGSGFQIGSTGGANLREAIDRYSAVPVRSTEEEGESIKGQTASSMYDALNGLPEGTE